MRPPLVELNSKIQTSCFENVKTPIGGPGGQKNHFFLGRLVDGDARTPHVRNDGSSCRNCGE